MLSIVLLTIQRIPLNDDRQEKANRLQSRQAAHEVQMNQIRSAATPLRKRRSLLGASPQTPAQDDDNGLPSIGGTAVTPMKRVPILANFEEWMKMATDNKINATNSWNFALIDYFHDMSLLKEGDGVNFQRASCTLDGCIKIYTNRVDSVATETGKLLSGLADSGNKRGKGEDTDEGAEDGEEAELEEGEDGARRKVKKKAQRSSEATLANSFAQLQLKKMELEFAVDPLFKKASADFDEGGAKGLLLNHLAIDSNGRIVFDSSDDAQDAVEGRESTPTEFPETQEVENSETEFTEIDISALGAKFFPDLARLDDKDICPSLKFFDISNANGSLDLPFLKAPDNWREEQEARRKDTQGETTAATPIFDDDDDGGLGNFDLPDDVGFGGGGEAWAKEAALDAQMRVHNITIANVEDENDQGQIGTFNPDQSRYGVTLRHGEDVEQENILNYFDKALQKNWAGPEHWKIRKVKEAAKATNVTTMKRKEKEPFEINFLAPMTQVLADALYTPAPSNSSISLPKSQWKSKTRNLLPDDKHFNSRQLLRLFLKPKAYMGSRISTSKSSGRMEAIPEGQVDEAYWGSNEAEGHVHDSDDPPQGQYDADFFQDDGLGAADQMDDDDDNFADARDHFSPPAEGVNDDAAEGESGSPLGGAFGAQLVTQSRRFRPEYVQYARVAKKVDVRRLKEEIWRGLAFEEVRLPCGLKDMKY